MSLRTKTSVHCLWNLALLYYYGDAISNNPLQQNINAAMPLFQRVIEMENEVGNEEDAVKTINDAKQFLEQISSIKDMFAECAIDFHRRIASVISEATQDCEDKGEMFYALKSLSLPEPYKIGLSKAKQEGHGSISHLYIYSDGDDLNDTEIFNYIQVEKSRIGAWQAYLLETCYTILPLFWHGCYNSRKFIFTEEDINEIPLLSTRDLSSLADIIYPSVDFIDANTASVKCCWWNEWNGLVRESVLVKYDGNKVSFVDPSYPIKRRETLIPYECGLRF
jgi:hypothetical protein